MKNYSKQRKEWQMTDAEKIEAHDRTIKDATLSP